MSLDEYAIGDLVPSKRYHRAEVEVDRQLDCDATPEGIRQAVKKLRALARAAEDLADRLAAKR
jgi:hypothetical protein